MSQSNIEERSRSRAGAIAGGRPILARITGPIALEVRHILAATTYFFIGLNLEELADSNAPA
jgi:hypothetical protein